MYQVILVDDEYYVRKSIQNRVNWAGLDCVIAAEAENGTQAFDLIAKTNPDIVLVDIMMPEMDGLELIRRAREISPDTQFAILSGYDDFLYTKEAIRLQVTDYIKKPVDVEELEKAVREMIRLIDASRQSRQRLNELVDQAQNLTEMKIDRALNEVCAGADAYHALQDLLPDGLYAWIIVYAAPSTPDSSRSLAANDLDRLKTDLPIFLQKSFSEKSYLAASDTDPSEIRILMPAGSSPAARQAAEEIAKYLSAVFPNQRLFLACSKLAPPAGLYDQYLFALRVLKSKIFQGQPGIQSSDGLRTPSQDEATAVFSLLESVKRCIASRQFNRLDGLLSQIFSEKLITSVQVLEDAMFSLYGLSREYAGRYKTRLPEQYAARMTGTHALLYYESLKSLKDEIQDLMLMFFCEGSSIDDDEITSHVKKYIEENFRENISLTSIAGLFYLNPSYLSSLFKKKAGVNLNKYIETARIEHAKTLLTGLNASVNDIAGMIGYSDPNYFTKVFKKRTGKTPSEYKEAGKKLGKVG